MAGCSTRCESAEDLQVTELDSGAEVGGAFPLNLPSRPAHVTWQRKRSWHEKMHLSEVVVSDILAGHFVDLKVACLSLCAYQLGSTKCEIG